MNSKIASYTILKSAVGLTKELSVSFVNLPKEKDKLDKTENSYMTYQATITFIIFWDFSMFYQIFLSAQVKRCVLTTYKHGIRSCLTSC